MIKVFQFDANLPVVKEVLTNFVTVGARSVTNLFKSDDGIASNSQDFGDISPIILMTSSSVISLKHDNILTLVFLVGVYLSYCCSTLWIYWNLSIKKFAKSFTKVSSLTFSSIGFSDVLPVMLFINLYIFLMSCSHSITFLLIDCTFDDLRMLLYLICSSLRFIQFSFDLFFLQVFSLFLSFLFWSLTSCVNHGTFLLTTTDLVVNGTNISGAFFSLVLNRSDISSMS